MHQGHFVTVLDNFFTGDRQNIEHWNGHPHFALIQHDVSNPIYLEGLFKWPNKFATLLLVLPHLDDFSQFLLLFWLVASTVLDFQLMKSTTWHHRPRLQTIWQTRLKHWNLTCLDPSTFLVCHLDAILDFERTFFSTMDTFQFRASTTSRRYVSSCVVFRSLRW